MYWPRLFEHYPYRPRGTRVPGVVDELLHAASERATDHRVGESRRCRMPAARFLRREQGHQ